MGETNCENWIRNFKRTLSEARLTWWWNQEWVKLPKPPLPMVCPETRVWLHNKRPPVSPVTKQWQIINDRTLKFKQTMRFWVWLTCCPFIVHGNFQENDGALRFSSQQILSFDWRRRNHQIETLSLTWQNVWSKEFTEQNPCHFPQLSILPFPILVS